MFKESVLSGTDFIGESKNCQIKLAVSKRIIDLLQKKTKHIINLMLCHKWKINLFFVNN